MLDRSIRLSQLEQALEQDGYNIVNHIYRFDKLGILAHHRTAFNYDTGQRKKVYYLEGSHYEMGYLLGFLAEEEITQMTEKFTEKIIFSFIGSKLLQKIEIIGEALVSIISLLAKPAFENLPKDIKDEIFGMMEGCKEKNSNTKVTRERLTILNVGFDIILSIIYTGNFLRKEIPDLRAIDLDIPLMCNAFSVFGSLAGNGHYFGRDFMFPTAGVFHNIATMLICNPSNEYGKQSYPFVSITAPGIVGSIAAMNIQGIALGVDMSPGSNCNPADIGINSLLLSRRCIQYGASCHKIVKIISEAKRGVAWNYIVSDGTRDRACVVEAGMTQFQPDLLRVPPVYYLPFLPDVHFINRFWTGQYQNGMLVRWNDYQYPSPYLRFNKQLWDFYNKRNHAKKILYPDALSPTGYINKSWKEQNCPSTFYFPPQRETRKELIIATNHFITPEMQFYAMHPWTSKIIGDRINDAQWRYDELNNQIFQALTKLGTINYTVAKQLIDFLSPYGKYPGYYAHNPKSRDGKELCIEGCTSVFDLKNLIVESHYGYFCDEWVRVTLPNYVDWIMPIH